MRHMITGLEENCIFEQMGVEKGDVLLEINGSKIKDVFDYRFLTADEYLEVLVKKKNGEEWLLEIEKDEDEDLGAVFSEPLMDKQKSCANNCMFCFIDQLPPGLRNTLYFKDDDARLSFLRGNYVTLTNIGERELERLIFYRFSPINVSVHTTDPDMRVKILKNKNAGKILSQLAKISKAGIEINCQIVLVKGVNDGVNLANTVSDLMKIPGVRSISVVPVGITSFREGLTAIAPFSKTDALEVLDIIRNEQEHGIETRGSRIVHAADEFYLMADKTFPEYAQYDGFPQLENGVGMSVLFEKEFKNKIKRLTGDIKKRSVTVVTGKLTEAMIGKLAKKFTEKFTNTEIKVIMVENAFFGGGVTVSGLLTGRDILAALKRQNITGRVLFPASCMRDGTNVFLDDMSVSDLDASSGAKCFPVEVNGGSFINALLDAYV